MYTSYNTKYNVSSFKSYFMCAGLFSCIYLPACFIKFGKGKLSIELTSHCLNFVFSLPLELLRRLSCSKQAVYVFRQLACFL